MREDELQEELRPCFGTELCGPVRQRMSRDMLKSTTPLEGPLDDGGYALIHRQGQETVLRFTIEDIVGELREVERLSARQLREVVMRSSLRCGDPDIAHLLRHFPRLEGFQMGFPIERVVNLQQIEWHLISQPFRRFHLLDLVGVDGRPDCCCREQAVWSALLFQAIADHLFR